MSGKMIRVILETPYFGDVERNTEYARACMRDSLLRGEAPYASHLLYTQPGVLLDHNPVDRELGITAGLEWGVVANLTAVYTNLGITDGMKKGITRAKLEGRPIEYRILNKWLITHPRHRTSYRVEEIMADLLVLYRRKQQDYGSQTDPFANLTEVAENLGISRWKVAQARLLEKVSRLKNIGNDSPANESREDSFKDIAIFSIIALALFEEEGGNS